MCVCVWVGVSRSDFNMTSFRLSSERIPSKFRVNSEFRAGCGQIPSKHLYSRLSFCAMNLSDSPWLAGKKEYMIPWGETDDVRN